MAADPDPAMAAAGDPAADTGRHAGRPSTTYAWYVVCLMAVINGLLYIDRYIVATLLVPIQKDLGASDTQMGLLTGLAFTLFYALAAVPIARITDRGNRRNLLTIAVAVWSAATALCGVVGSYVQMLLARVGVAAGESAGTPAIYSMISDLFPANQRASAVGLFFVGASVGVFGGSYLGGLINDHYGWRVALMAAGAPGLFIAIVLYLTVKEPVRGAFDKVRPTGEHQSLMAVIRYLASIRTFWSLTLGSSIFAMTNSSWLSWAPTLLMRIHGLTTTQLGMGIGLAVAIGGSFGNFFGGRLSDRWARDGVRRYVQYTCGISLTCIPIVIAYLFAPTATIAMALLLPLALVSSGFYGASIAAALAIVTPQTRGTTVAIFGLCLNLITGFGPLLVGVLSDWRAADGVYAIRNALLVLPVLYATAAAFFYVASRNIDADAARVMQ